MSATDLNRLHAGQLVIFGGNQAAVVSDELAQRFEPGDKILVDPGTADILHIPGPVAALVEQTVSGAVEAFSALAQCSDEQISAFFELFAEYLAADDRFEPILAANRADVSDAAGRGRSTTRLVLDDAMRAQMIDGLRGWRSVEGGRDREIRQWRYPEWELSARTAPLGVVGFVFEGRPNVFADAAGVVRSGNTAVLRIGSDALRTAESIMEHAVEPALRAASLPAGTVGLLRSPERAAGWALFSDHRLALAVARGSGPAVAQLGAVARQHGIDVSVHGTGGAWMVIGDGVDSQRISDVVATSLDRKVCNTLNTVVLVDDVDTSGAAVLAGLARAAELRGVAGRVHATPAALAVLQRIDPGCCEREVDVARADGVNREPYVTVLNESELGTEWEWEGSPEISIDVAPDLDDAVNRCNRYSPHFVVSILTADRTRFDEAFHGLDAPFVGDGMTRWVDGQFALQTPELGLSNWESGRLLGRGGVLSGDGIYTIRYRAHIPGSLRR